LAVLAAATPLNAQVVKVDEPGACFTCHDDIQGELKKKSPHTSFAEGKCSDCHNPHASRHAALLKESPGDLCQSCHEDLKQVATLSSKHQPAANGECLSCHDPHASDFRNQ